MISKVSIGLVALIAIGTARTFGVPDSVSAQPASVPPSEVATTTTEPGPSTTTTTTDETTTTAPVPPTTSTMATSTTDVGPTTSTTATSTTDGPPTTTEPTTTIPGTVPGAPALTARRGVSSVDLSWTTPPDGGQPILGYEVHVRAAGTTTWTQTITTASTSYRVTGLDPIRWWTFRVSALNAHGLGTFSRSVDAAPGQAREPRLKYPTPSNASIIVGWFDWDYLYTDQPKPWGVRIQYRRTGATTWTTSGTVSPDDERYLVTGLVNGLSYDVMAVALYPDGVALVSDVMRAVPRTVPSVPRAPFIIAGHHAIGIEWLPPSSSGGTPITGYRVQVSWDGRSWYPWSDRGYSSADGPLPVTKTWGVIDRPVPGTGVMWMKPGRRLYVRVAAVNAAGTGPYLSLGSAVPYTYPGYPTNVRVSPVYRGANVSWTAPSSTGFRPLAPYEIQVRRRGTSTWTTVGRTSSTQFRISGLANGYRYCVRVIARNTGGDGSISTRVGFTAGSWAYYDPQGWTCY